MGATLPLEDLRADCSRCTGLCCVLLPYRRDAGFAIDKAGGVPCPNLAADDRCSIHAELRERGWAGCASFDCFGAGQFVTEVTYSGGSWRDPGADLGEMAAVLSVVRVLHETARHLTEAGRLAGGEDRAAAAALLDRVVAARDLDAEGLLRFDLDTLHDEAGDLLGRVSREVRGGAGADLGRADLAGADLRTRDLRAADLRGALLIGADLRGADLTRADLLGADLRAADLRGADLAQSLFVTEPQLAAARGDERTRVSPDLRRPASWTTA